MKCSNAVVIAVLSFEMLSGSARADGNAPRYWPQWRGPDGTGAAPDANPPVTWSETNNVRWKVEIPGKGHGTPIVWGDHVFVQTAVRTPQRAKNAPESGDATDRTGQRRRRRQRSKPTHIFDFIVMAIDRATGKVVWERTAVSALPHESLHPTSTQASASPVTDGEHLIAYFGSRGIYGYDMGGRLLWSKDLGDMTTRRSFGEGSSPVLYGDTVVVNWDHEGDSFIVALDKATGKQKWKVARDEITSWSTPIVVEVGGTPQVIVNATNRTRGYDLTTGRVIWECGGQTTNTVPSPIYGHGLVYAMSGFRGSKLNAIRLAEARGDITDSAVVAWTHDEDTPYVPSPVLLGDALYFLKVNRGILSCLNAKTGKPIYGPERLSGIDAVYSSPVAARDRVYVSGRDGTTVVIKQGSTFEIMATNKIDDGLDASLAIVDDEIYLRGSKHLYCIARD